MCSDASYLTVILYDVLLGQKAVEGSKDFIDGLGFSAVDHFL